jgi:putative transposase
MSSSYPSRQAPRLKGYDYSSAGAYFLTICTDGRRCCFGVIEHGNMKLNGLGRMVHDTWASLGSHYAGVEIDHFVVMPNHLHGILLLHNNGSDPTVSQLPISEIVRRFKTYTATQLRKLVASGQISHDGPLWQRNYHEHVIRDELDLHAHRTYTVDNPQKWSLDHENPDYHP